MLAGNEISVESEKFGWDNRIFCEFILPSAREWYAAKKVHNALIIASNRLGR